MARVHAVDATTLEWVACSRTLMPHEVVVGDEVLAADGYAEVFAVYGPEEGELRFEFLVGDVDGEGQHVWAVHAHAPVRVSKSSEVRRAMAAGPSNDGAR